MSCTGTISELHGILRLMKGYQFPVPIQMSCTGTISQLHGIFTPEEGGYQFPVLTQMSCTGTISELHSIFTPDEEGGEVSISGAYPDVMQRNKVKIVCIFMPDERG